MRTTTVKFVLLELDSCRKRNWWDFWCNCRNNCLLHFDLRGHINLLVEAVSNWALSSMKLLECPKLEAVNHLLSIRTGDCFIDGRLDLLLLSILRDALHTLISITLYCTDYCMILFFVCCCVSLHLLHEVNSFIIIIIRKFGLMLSLYD